MALTIRRYRPAEDAPGLTALVDGARRRGELPDMAERDVPWFVQFVETAAQPVAMAVDDDGALAGALMPEPKIVIVEPALRRRGIATALIAEGLRIERERGRPNLLLGPRAGDQAAVAFLRASGFRLHSTVWRLDLPADVSVQPPSLPADLVARTFRAGDEEAYADAFNAAFADHPTPLVFTAEVVRLTAADPEFDPSGSLFLVPPERPGWIEAFCDTDLRRETDGGPVTEGEIAWIGVRPEAQGRGLGRELLRWGVARLRAHAPVVYLTVNVANPRALALYERHGFVRTAEKPRWARPVDA